MCELQSSERGTRKLPVVRSTRVIDMDNDPKIPGTTTMSLPGSSQ